MADRGDLEVRAHELKVRLGELVPAGTIEVTLFASGALDVLVRAPDGPVIVMEGSADQSEFGLTPNLRAEDAGFHSGHSHVFDSYDDAVEALLNLLRGG